MQSEVLRHRELIVTGSVDRAILHLGAPAALAALLQAGFLVVDTFWLGRVGPVALAAASTAGFMMWIAQTIGEGLGVGSGALLAQGVGSSDRAGADRAAAAGLVLAVWGALATSAAGLVSIDGVFEFMGTEAAVTAAGRAYLLVILAGMPAYFLFAWIAAAFRAAGDARTPLGLLGLAATVNVVVDPLLIFGVGPLPRLEVTGAALATVLAWLAAAAAGWHRLGRLGVRPRPLEALRPTGTVIAALWVGLPVAAEGALFSVIYIFLTRIITGFGTAPVAALGIGHKLEVFNYFVCAGMGAAATTMVGQSLGAGDHVRARRTAWRSLYLTCLPVGAVTLVLVSAPAAAVAVFSPDPGVIAAGATYVLLVGLSQVFMAFEVVLLGALAGARWTVAPAALQILLTAARVPLAWWLVEAGWGLEGVWLAISATTVVKGLLLAGLFALRTRDPSPASLVP